MGEMDNGFEFDDEEILDLDGEDFEVDDVGMEDTSDDEFDILDDGSGDEEFDTLDESSSDDDFDTLDADSDNGMVEDVMEPDFGESGDIDDSELGSDVEEAEDGQGSADDYIDGVPVDSNELLEDDSETDIQGPDGFISNTGDFVVMDRSQEDAFELITLDIDSIAITPRIRKNPSVDDLTRSIKSTGLLMPIVVAPTATEGLYVLLNGWRRVLACAKAGKRKIPCIVNNKVSTPEIRILESLYNHSRSYGIKEMVDYIDFLEKEKGIMSPSMIEYLLQMNSGDYTKLKDVLNDNDDDIVTKLYDGLYTIDMAFKKLEQRRKKESQEEKQNKQAEKVYDNAEESGIDQIEDSGEEAEGEALTDEQVKSLMLDPAELDDDSLAEESLQDMVNENKEIPGFEPHQQKVGEREIIDPIIKKSVLAKFNNTCQCCKRGGEQYVDILDIHHIVPVFLSGKDDIDNCIPLCVACHRLVHLYSTDDLHIDSALVQDASYDSLDEEKQARYINEQIFEDEKMRFKKVVTLGGKIRKGIAAKGMNKEKYKKEHPNNGIGRNLPGVGADKQTRL